MKKWLYIIVALALLFPASKFGWYKMTQETIEATVSGKERDSAEQKYLVFTDKTTFELSENWFYWQFGTSDMYGKLVVGKKYELTAVGIRLPFLSWYPNIVGYQAAK